MLLTILFSPLVGLIFGIVGGWQSSRYRLNGFAWAITGIVLALLWMALFDCFIFLVMGMSSFD